jgi:hypothetical protein
MAYFGECGPSQTVGITQGSLVNADGECPGWRAEIVIEIWVAFVFSGFVYY